MLASDRPYHKSFSWKFTESWAMLPSTAARESLMADVTNFPANDPKYTADKSHAGNIIIKTGALSVQIDMASEQALFTSLDGTVIFQEAAHEFTPTNDPAMGKDNNTHATFQSWKRGDGRCTEEVSFRMGF